MFKQKHRKTIVNCLKDLVEVAEQSAVVNTAQLVGDQDGNVIVPMYDWSTFFSDHFTKLVGITKLHHFYCCADKPAIVVVRELVDSPTVTLDLLDDKFWAPSADDLPSRIIPKGLSLERRSYLYQKIREYCSPETKDLVCPYPGPGPCPPSPSLAGPPSPSLNGNGQSTPDASANRKRRRCGQCGEEGHNTRTCKKTQVNFNNFWALHSLLLFRMFSLTLLVHLVILVHHHLHPCLMIQIPLTHHTTSNITSP